MAKQTQYRRLAWLGLLLCLAFAGLGYRLVDLQVLRHEELMVEAEKNTEKEYILEPRRGDILDIKGNPLATTVMMKRILADQTYIGTNQVQLARVLAPLLQIEENRLVQLLTPTARTATNGLLVTNIIKYVCLCKKVPVETWGKVQKAVTNIVFAAEPPPPSRTPLFYSNLRQHAIFSEDFPLRVYPSQTLAAQVLGYVAEASVKRDGKTNQELAGLLGVEKTFNAKLTGVRGWRRTEADSLKREVVTLRDQHVEATDGYNVVLTIDSVIQHIVETALAAAMEKQEPLSASGIVVRPRTGEILAMATLPSFDPNDFGHARPETMRNRVVSDMAEPGSTFKIVVVSGALNEGAVRLTDSFDCEHGVWLYAGRKLHDHERYGVLTVEQIITKSSNIGAAKIGVKLGEDHLYDYMHDFGFGQYTMIPLPTEGPGYMPKVKSWSKVSIAQMPMGQGISVTRLQMIMAMCAIANKGVLMRPMLVDRLEDADHKKTQYTPQRVRQVISESTAKLMVQALKTVVATNGTAAKAALEHYTVAGKTGTAQKAEHGFYVEKFFSSFIGFFPADNPELCISVTLDEPKHGHYGGIVAAPYFKQIAEAAANYLNLRPEDGEIPARPDPLAPVLESPAIRTAAAHSPP